MGTGGFRVAQDHNRALESIVKKKTKVILRIIGHLNENIESKFSMNIPFEFTEEITKKTIDESVKEFESLRYTFESLELYKISVQRLKVIYESIENYKKPFK